MTSTRLSTANGAQSKADALVIFAELTDGGFELRAAGDLSRATVTHLRTLLEAVAGRLRSGDVRIAPSTGIVKAPVIAFTVLSSLDPEEVRQAAGAAARQLTQSPKVAAVSPSPEPAVVAAVAQGIRLGAYAFTGYRAQPLREPLRTLTICTSSARKSSVKSAVEQSDAVTDAVLATRDLVNTPPADLTPDALATWVRRSAADTSLRVETYDEGKLARAGYGGIVGVGQGSVHPPRLVRMTYRPAKAKTHLALVGKGVTFDSGGLSLKTPTSMITMKCDMAGAAAVANATLTAARRKLPVRITAYLALAENLPGSTAQRPGDVLTTYNGTTVEVLNTDAEGRLLLADALARACEDSPDLLIDVATLTGAQMVALGMEVGAVMASDTATRDLVLACAHAAGEAMWPMPLPAALRASLDSPVADLANIGERMGSMLTAGVFLREFVTEGTAWAHLDIAGPAFNESSGRDYCPPGGTGYAVRTLVELAAELAS